MTNIFVTEFSENIYEKLHCENTFIGLMMFVGYDSTLFLTNFSLYISKTTLYCISPFLSIQVQQQSWSLQSIRQYRIVCVIRLGWV